MSLFFALNYRLKWIRLLKVKYKKKRNVLLTLFTIYLFKDKICLYQRSYKKNMTEILANYRQKNVYIKLPAKFLRY